MKRKKDPIENTTLPKAPTGIEGLDEITGGGLPAGRPTLICGGAGCGKTLLAMEFLARGAMAGECGVYMMFEENVAELVANARSLGFELDHLMQRKKIVLDHVYIERTEFEETGEYNLEGLFIRLGHAIDSIGAKRVVLDTIEALFSGLPNHAMLRAELRRLFRWLKDRGITAVVTGERGEGGLTRYGLEEYVADCVIVLDHRVNAQISTRRLRVLKYRGTTHGMNEYPFIITSHGISVMPITSLRLDHKAASQRVSTGILKLDEMLGGKGVFRGSSMLVSGSPGTGKSSIAAKFVEAACRRGERALLFAYEESVEQIIRNMRSIGIDLEQWVKKGLLDIHASRPTLQGLEQHLVAMHDLVRKFRPSVVGVDPISNLTFDDSEEAVKPTLMRLIDYLKQLQITAIFCCLTPGGTTSQTPEDSQVGVSSLMDVWLMLRNVELNGERNRTLYILKARGMHHSNQVREFVLSDKGIDLLDVVLMDDRVLTGSARATQEAQMTTHGELREQNRQRKARQLASKRKAVEAQIAMLQAELESQEEEMNFSNQEEIVHEKKALQNVRSLAAMRSSSANNKPTTKQ
ncbi:circadian clock protein KaiC [Prosthecobacter sp.]|uniref:circadian clock protein KaiC n=1 Tax=Prosthecobacter sp. TaxID=1965333 RepID=UPI003784F210